MISTAHLSPSAGSADTAAGTRPTIPSPARPVLVGREPETVDTGTDAEPELDASPTRETVLELAACQDPDREEQLRDDLVLQHLALASSIAMRYRDRGIPLEDLRQVAHLALTKASRRFDAHAGHRFVAFCAPTIRGEVRRHFRDQGWMVRPPRRVQDLQPRVQGAEETLHERLGRAPSEVELAAHLDVPVESLRESQSSLGCFVAASLDRPVGEAGSGVAVGDLLPAEEGEQGPTEARVVLHPHLQRLGERDRRILQMRFVDDLTQREIAAEIGVTQMQVSRLLTRILSQLRAGVGELA